MIKTAILILSYNSQPFLNGCIGSLQHQTTHNFDTYLIDNHSSDNTVSFVAQNFPTIKVIQHPQNYGVGKGFNLVIQKLLNNYDYFCLLNPDVVLDKNTIKTLRQTLIQNKNIDIVAPTIIYQHNQLIDTLGGRFVNPLLGIFGGIFGGQSFKDIPNFYQQHIFPAFFATITCMLIRQDVFSRFGFLDESFFMYFDDIDLCWRLHLGGGQIVANPKALVYHFGHGSIKTAKAQNKILQIIETNLLLTYYKNLSTVSLFLLLPLLLFNRGLISLLYFPISPQITTSKISGIIMFVKILLTKKYQPKRKNSQNLRKTTDIDLAKNFSFVSLGRNDFLKIIFSWLTGIKNFYQNKQ